MTFDLSGGRRLVLAGAGFGGFWLAAGAAAVVLLLVLYREERRLVSRRAGLGLLGAAVLAAVVLVLGPVRADRGADLPRDGPGPGDRRRGRLREHGDRRPRPDRGRARRGSRRCWG